MRDGAALHVDVSEKYATGWLRFCAGFVDAVVFLPFAMLLMRLPDGAPTSLILALLVAWTIIGVAYSVVLHGLFGQTIGKRLLRVKVLDLSEDKLSMKQAVLRDAPWILMTCAQTVFGIKFILAGGNPFAWGARIPMPSLLEYSSLMWFAAEVLTMLTNAKRRALHDWIAGSVVVRT